MIIISIFNDFPHTRNSDQDFGWLIKYYKDLEGQYDGLVETVKRLEDLYDTIPQQIADEIANQMIGVYNTLTQMRNQLEAMGIKVDGFEQDLLSIRQALAAFYAIISAQTDNKIEALKLWVQKYVENWAKTLPPVVCPIHGYLEPLQDVLFHIVDYLGCGITALEYDNYSVSAQEYDNMEITAIDYDLWAKCKYFYPKKWSYMHDPFTGEYLPITIVVNKLADLHKHGITAQQYDNLEEDAGAYDALNISAYKYDWENPLAV